MTRRMQGQRQPQRSASSIWRCVVTSDCVHNLELQLADKATADEARAQMRRQAEITEQELARARQIRQQAAGMLVHLFAHLAE